MKKYLLLMLFFVSVLNCQAPVDQKSIEFLSKNLANVKVEKDFFTFLLNSLETCMEEAKNSDESTQCKLKNDILLANIDLGIKNSESQNTEKTTTAAKNTINNIFVGLVGTFISLMIGQQYKDMGAGIIFAGFGFAFLYNFKKLYSLSIKTNPALDSANAALSRIRNKTEKVYQELHTKKFVS